MVLVCVVPVRSIVVVVPAGGGPSRVPLVAIPLVLVCVVPLRTIVVGTSILPSLRFYRIPRKVHLIFRIRPLSSRGGPF